MSIRLRVYGFLAIAAAAGAGIYFANQKFHFLGGTAKATAKSEPGKGPGKDAVPVELTTAARGPISSHISSTANLRALRDVTVTAQSDGLVRRVAVEEGDLVKAGDLLCELDDTQWKIRLELARQRLAQARLQLEKANVRQQKAAVQIENIKTEVERYQKAHKEGLVSEQEVAQRIYQLDELQHDRKVSASESREFGHRVAELEAEIVQSELEISKTRITAAFGGYITRRTVEMGQQVRNLDALFQLGSFSPLYADVFLSEREAHEVHAAQPATVILGVDQNSRSRGTVERISPVVDPATGTVKVTVEIRTTESGFRPGAFVRVEIRTDTRSDAVLIPKRAVIEEDGEYFVFVANGSSAKRAKVSLGYEADGKVEIRNGVSAGDQVVVAGQGALKEGSKIRVVRS